MALKLYADLLIFIFSLVAMQEEFPMKGYDKVLLYQIEMDKQSGISRMFDAHGKLTSNSKGLEVNHESINELIEIVNDTSTYGARHSYSHSPTIGLIFYRNSKMIDWLEIALPTNSILTKSKIKNQQKYYDLISDNVEYPLTGLSPKGRQRIRQWIMERGIREQLHNSHWDSTEIDYSRIKRKF